MTDKEARLAIMGAISMELKNPTLQQGFEIICKENAELKKTVLQFQKDSYCGVCHFKTKTQLKQAKDLLKQWLQASKSSGCDNINIVTEAEQFLNEVEK